ncbi:MAG: His-Xaa-Ser system protein HxsD [Polyangiaceae bacterium]
MTQNPSAPDEATAEAVDFTFELSEREIAFDIDEDLYAPDAIYGAAYLFIDRCYVFLARPADRKVRVRLRSKGAASAEELEALAGEFANELLNSQLRFRIGRATAPIREHYMARAFFGREQNATIAELLAELDAEEMAEEPLEIPVPWEAGREKASDG